MSKINVKIIRTPNVTLNENIINNNEIIINVILKMFELEIYGSSYKL